MLMAVGFTLLFTSDVASVEHYYSNGFYQYISKGVRLVAGPFPFSIGDILYSLLIVWAGWKLVRFFKELKHNTNKLAHFRMATFRVLWVCLVGWLVFQWCWGINYYRMGIPEQFGLQKKKPEQSEVERFAHLMLEQVNANAGARERDKDFALNSTRVQNAYGKLSAIYPNLHYSPVAFKSSLFGVIGNYMGYSGYFNPLSGEAQVNTHMPDFIQPFTGLHEVAHQLGYAKESEASFIGFLAAYHSGDSTFQYSASLEMFLFAQGALYRADSTKAKALKKALPPVAKKDLEAYRQFYLRYQGPVDDLTTWFYSRFLKWNNQPEGMHSYNRSMVYVLRYILDNPVK
ncbi:MAG: hypothetical protein RLZZ557_1468 [Bacteroidota bacterium]